MKFICTGVIALSFVSFTISGQTGTSEVNSNILKVNKADSVLVKVEMKNAMYDAAKNYVPYYTINRSTAYNETAVPTLITRKTSVVTGDAANVIRKVAADQLGKEFTLRRKNSLSGNENLNIYELLPFRISAAGEVEELVDYDASWEIVTNSNLKERSAASNFKSSSVLASGEWYKIGITETGIHKITRTFLRQLGINMNTLDPRKIRIYGNGGRMVPERNKDFRYDDLEENAILVADGGDGSFDNQDYVLFYATGTTNWTRRRDTSISKQLKFLPEKNRFSDTSFYYINVNIGEGKRVSTRASLQQTPDYITNAYDYRNLHEVNVINFGKTGREFYGEYFDLTNNYTFTWNDGDFVVGDTIIAYASLVGNSSTNTQFLVSGNGVNIPLITAGINPQDEHPVYANPATGEARQLNTAPGQISITASKLSTKGVGWFDKLVVNARRNLNVGTKQFQFRETRNAKPGKTCRFLIGGSITTGMQLWNVSDPVNPFVQEANVSGTGIEFTASADSVNEYCVAPAGDLYTPVIVGKVANQNLHSLQQADYVIIAHPLFLKEAHRLGTFHQKQEGYSYLAVSTDEIYNEFSSGIPDASGVRDFIRMIYTRNAGSAKPLKYVLLMGDGSYNNKSKNLTNNSSLIPTYQSHNSLSSTESVATDDFYGLMDPEEGYYAEESGNIDIGIGRFPCRSSSEVAAIIAKIENYYAKDLSLQASNTTPVNCNNSGESTMGDWRNWLMFLADDKDWAEHMKESNQLAEMVKRLAPVYNLDKIYLDAYQRFSTPGGSRYPGASEDFIKRIRKGALIFNYTGHGGEVGLTAERLIDIPLINNLDNFNKLPLFITATCEFSRYDDPSRTSAGELSILNPKGGAIALMTTSRLAFSTTNLILNDRLLINLFTRQPDGTMPALGDAIRLTKRVLTQKFWYANFVLLGDPALRLAYPKEKVYTTHINNIPVGSKSSDTLSALAKITIAGYVGDAAGNKLDFNGVVYPTVFDKEQMASGLLNDHESSIIKDENMPFTFLTQKNMLYRGKVEVKHGDFSFTFLVPKDISVAHGKGKISYYASTGSIDANGFYTNVVVGGDPKNSFADSDGPKIELFMNDKNFVNGGITNEKPILYADLTDSSGINTVGSGLGHDITVILDENSTKPVILNDYYEANLNSYQSGRVRYPFEELATGEHKLTFKVWDIQNNSSVVYSDFVVAESAELALRHVLNYPNPFTTRTKFFFEHNQACNPLKVTVQVYTVSGKIVKTIQRDVICEGYKPDGIEWDGRDDYGDKLGRGVYIYRLAILDINNKKAEKIEKLVILN